MGILKKSVGGSDQSPPASIKHAAAQQPKPQMRESRPYLVRNPPPPLLIPRQKRAYRVIPNRTDHTREVVRSYDIQALQAEVAYLNRVISRACELAHVVPALSLDLSQFVYSTSRNGTHYTWFPYTPFGQVSRYPLMLHYQTKAQCPAPFSESEEYQAWPDFLATGGTAKAWEALYGTATGIQPLLPDTAFGKIYYLKSGLIGRARLVFWRDQMEYILCLEPLFKWQTQHRLVLRKFIRRDPEGNEIVLFET